MQRPIKNHCQRATLIEWRWSRVHLSYENLAFVWQRALTAAEDRNIESNETNIKSNTKVTK